ncbi:MAG: galactokinase family protein [Eubacteriales bacterium]|nr:galactokinase family protein [Eubacteriales bacterium]
MNKNTFQGRYSQMKKIIFTPGRTELAGNHTDHQKGRILAAGVELGLTVVCEPTDDNIAHIESVGHKTYDIPLSKLDPTPEEYGTSKSLARGMLGVFKDLGLNIGGFDALITSTLPVGSGMSSSAAFSVLIGKILSELYNDGKVDPVVIARAAQESENRYFGKPCGLMDQLACSLGHCVYVDFLTNEITPINARFEDMGLTMCLTDTGGSHAGLDSSYARIPADMVYIANLFDKGVLGDVDPKAFYAKGWSKEDRPVRRAMHFFGENERVPKMRDALIKGNGEEYMRLMNESGRSSEELLNNIVTSASGDTKLAEGLEFSRGLLEGKGAWRVHGGGFAGCVQALMPIDYYETYKTEMEKKFGSGSCLKITLA